MYYMVCLVSVICIPSLQLSSLGQHLSRQHSVQASHDTTFSADMHFDHPLQPLCETQDPRFILESHMKEYSSQQIRSMLCEVAGSRTLLAIPFVA